MHIILLRVKKKVSPPEHFHFGGFDCSGVVVVGWVLFVVLQQERKKRASVKKTCTYSTSTYQYVYLEIYNIFRLVVLFHNVATADSERF